AVVAALRAGASAYIAKSVDPGDIATVLRLVSNGVVYNAPERAATSALPGGLTLTEREMAILGAVASGLTTKAISRKLWVSEHTVKFHLTNIYRKLGVPNRAGAVRYALEHRVVEFAA